MLIEDSDGPLQSPNKLKYSEQYQASNVERPSLAKTVLLVDDDEDLRELITELLQFDGHKVEAAEDGAAANDLLQQRTFDLILLDWDLPGLSGPEVCKSYRSRGGESQVILMTGMDPKIVENAAANAGASAYLLKPFTLDKFHLSINKALNL